MSKHFLNQNISSHFGKGFVSLSKGVKSFIGLAPTYLPRLKDAFLPQICCRKKGKKVRKNIFITRQVIAIHNSADFDG
jgi:hypothetical protein